MKLRSLCLVILFGMFMSAFAWANDTVKENYRKHCSECHGPDRLGAMGPALLPDNLHRLKKKQAIEVIRDGRVATQMPAFKTLFNDEQINGLVDFIYSKPQQTPVWGEENIRSSHTIFIDAKTLPDKPVHHADPMNMFVVVELGDHHATVLDGDSFEPIHRFKTHFALHGGPKYSPDGRFVYFASRDGWISKFDMWSL